MEEPTNCSTIHELQDQLRNCQQRFDEKCAECRELETKNRALDDAITNLTKIIKSQNKELSDMKTSEKERELCKLKKNSRRKGTKFCCTVEGCDYFTDNKADFDFHVNVHETATLKCPYCMYLSFNIRDLRRHVTSSTKHCRFMYACQYCKNDPPYMTNNETHFRNHILKHFPGAIDDDRMDFLIESIHSAAPLTVWKALDSMYKVCDIVQVPENYETSKRAPKRRRDPEMIIEMATGTSTPLTSLSASTSSSTSSSPSPHIQQIPLVIEQQLPVSEYQWTPEVSGQQSTTIEVIPDDPLSSIINDTIAGDVQMEVIPQCSSSSHSLQESLLQQTVSECIPTSQTIMEMQYTGDNDQLNMGSSLTDSLTGDCSQMLDGTQEEASQQSDLLEDAESLNQTIQLSDLNAFGNDFIFYLSDENCELSSLDSSQICVIQHISRNPSDGLTHVTLEPHKNLSYVPDSFIEEEILPMGMNDCSQIIESQLAQC